MVDENKTLMLELFFQRINFHSMVWAVGTGKYLKHCLGDTDSSFELGLQLNFSGSNTDGSFIMAVSNTCLSPQ